MPKKDELSLLERAVSDALDEWVCRIHGIYSGWSYPKEFIEWIEKRGYQIVPLDSENGEELG